jgi:hypothetical protein
VFFCMGIYINNSMRLHLRCRRDSGLVIAEIGLFNQFLSPLNLQARFPPLNRCARNNIVYYCVFVVGYVGVFRQENKNRPIRNN